MSVRETDDLTLEEKDGSRTHVSRVAPDWDLYDALPTELPRRGRDE